jgi:FMN-dependent oxidoreductase (nitrilotriacetate monooxygenase family)
MFHLAWFSSFTQMGWQDTWAGNMGSDWMLPDRWQDFARSLERGCFDCVVFEDESFIESLYGGSIDYYVRSGTFAAKSDPAVLATVISEASTRLGVVATLNTGEYPPYLLARLMNTLDHLSKGRVGWNVVTGQSRNGALNYGKTDLPEHDERYDIADEFIELVDRLWKSWEPDAMVLDRETGVFADPAKVHTVDFEGAHFKSKGPLNNFRSPQERPVIFQAGASPRGKDFASRHADAVVGGMTGASAMKAYRDDIRARAVGHGRKPSDVKVFFQVTPILGTTPGEAFEAKRYIEERAAADVERGLAGITLGTGVDLSRFDLDSPMSVIAKQIETNYGQSSLATLFDHAGDQTLREFASQPPSWRTNMPCGTPDQVAGQMGELMEEVGGDGFLVSNFYGSTRRFVAEITDGLVPALQRRKLTRTGYTFEQLRDNLLEF